MVYHGIIPGDRARERVKLMSWFEDKEFWRNFGPLMFDQERLEGTEREAQNIIRLTGARQGDSILDCCCGFGRHVLAFAGLGLNASGLDYNEDYIRRAKGDAEQQGLAADFFRGDVREPFPLGDLRVITNLFTSFGYFDEEADQAFLKNVFQALKSRGLFFMEMLGKETLAMDFEERTWFERDGIKILLEKSADLNWTRLHNRWIFFDGDKLVEKQFSHRVYSALELGERLFNAGFERIDFYGDWDGSPYDHHAKRLIALARKA